jgi:hypothetical protein
MRAEESGALEPVAHMPGVVGYRLVLARCRPTLHRFDSPDLQVRGVAAGREARLAPHRGDQQWHAQWLILLRPGAARLRALSQ